MSAHLGQLTIADKKLLQQKVEDIQMFITNRVIPINDDHLDACVDYIVTKLIIYKESDPFEAVKKIHYEN